MYSLLWAKIPTLKPLQTALKLLDIADSEMKAYLPDYAGAVLEVAKR
ncbi:MAG: hypothetical protein HXX08_16825 [Chloroflexi bacterium]|uniref:Uncharacterized protein n=1 Tax=Candidatus Chlorohelix allophototropha TaxID=3003348 RepID=A0A8T7M605_9CHLR|nr:hypothetical protein [Chloroflexota bacterium]WJW69436.1 hypothetical protein OZ401_003047 [Chloroflexota bacterium L227-S17]